MGTINPISSGAFQPVELPHEVPITFSTFPKVEDVRIPHGTEVGLKAHLGLIQEKHSLLENNAVQTWADTICSDELFLAISSWCEKKAKESEGIQLDCFKHTVDEAVRLFDALSPPSRANQ